MSLAEKGKWMKEKRWDVIYNSTMLKCVQIVRKDGEWLWVRVENKQEGTKIEIRESEIYLQYHSRFISVGAFKSWTDEWRGLPDFQNSSTKIVSCL